MISVKDECTKIAPFIRQCRRGLDCRGPALFQQTRTGLNGREFEILKFRSMYVDAEKAGPQWASARDPRVTRIGRLLRILRLDELPQIINVIKGEMSFIGPRPERPVFVRELEKQIPFYDLRQLVRPGITGWAQVMYTYGASTDDALEKLQYDLYYIKNYSFLLDFAILLTTLPVFILGKGKWPKRINLRFSTTTYWFWNLASSADMMRP